MGSMPWLCTHERALATEFGYHCIDNSTKLHKGSAANTYKGGEGELHNKTSEHIFAVTEIPTNIPGTFSLPLFEIGE